MTVHSKINYDDQDYGHILKAARKQQYIIFPAPIAFPNDELKEELGMKTKKDDEEDDTEFCSLEVLIDPTDKDSKTEIVKIHKYDTGTPEEFQYVQ
jgi:ATP sulfurylase